jgi:HlyD family secretion protein
MDISAVPPIAHAPSRRRSRVLAHILRWSVAIGLVVVAGLACWRYAHLQTAPVVRYQTGAVDHGPIAARVTASGAVSALVTVQVGSQVSGRIQAWSADFNTPVKKGQLIAVIDPSYFQAAVAQARANYAAARAGYDKAIANRLVGERNYARELALFEHALASRQDLDAAEAQAESSRADVAAADATIQQTRAALDQAVLNLSYTKIVSPIDGIVISRNIDVGQTVAASFQAPTLFTIAQDLRKMQVDTNVAEGDIGKIREGMEATFTVDAYPTRTYHGTVRQVRDNAQTIQNVVTYDAVVDVDNADLSLRPTMTANATFVYATKDEAVRLPNGALRFKPDAATIAAMSFGAPAPAVPGKTELAADQRVVWVMRGGRPAPVVVRVGISDGMVTEVAEGDLRPGDVVVTEATTPAGARR